MKTLDINHRARRCLKHLAVAVAVATGLLAGSAQAQTTTVIDLGSPGSGTSVTAGTPVLKIGLGTLPPGSLLRSVTLNYRLDGGNPYLGDLAPLFADSNGNNGVLMIAGEPNDNGYPKPATTRLPWNSGDDYSEGATGTVTLTATESLPAIDLSDYAVWLQTGWDGTWSGSITLVYDTVPLAVAVSSPGVNQSYETGTSITASATVWEAGTFTDTVTFHTTPISPPGPTVETVSSDTSSPFSASLGALPSGTYQIYATVANTNTPPGNATSATRTFTVAAATPTTIVLNAAGPATTYGDNVTFTAMVDPVPSGGTVQFLDGENYVGSPVAVNTTTGEASVSTTTLGATTHTITAEYSGYQIYETSTTVSSISQEVGKAPLTVKALNTLRAPNTANTDPLPYQISGYQNGQNLASSGVTGTPELTTAAVLASPPGDYVVTCLVGTLDASNYSFTLENGTLTVADVADTFSVNFHFSPGSFTPEQTANILVPSGVPAGLDDWFTSGWLNFEVPFGVGTLPPVTVTSNQGSTATFQFNDARNGWVYDGPRTTFLGDGNYNMMDGHVNSTLEGVGHKFDMEMTGIPFATYDVIFYMGANLPQFGDGTGVIKFNGGADRAFKLKPGAFDGTFTEMVDATTEGNYIVFTNVTGSSFTTQTWGTGPGDFNHVGPFGFQIREATATTGFTAWADANDASGQTADQDHDDDGVENGVEYFMGETGSTFTAMPGLDGTNTITWPMDPAYAGTYEVQTSPDLGTWTNVDPRPVPVSGNLSYLLPPGLGIQFVRLLVTPTP